jgi:hypothetical protein
VAVVGLAKIESPAIEEAVAAAGAPPSAVGVVIALLVLVPETLAAVRNARRDRVQTSFSLAFGSAMASIGLTIPAIAVASIWLEGPLALGLGPTQMVLLALTVVVGRADRPPRPGHPPGGRRPPGHLRGLPVPRPQPLTRVVWWPAGQRGGTSKVMPVSRSETRHRVVMASRSRVRRSSGRRTGGPQLTQRGV